MSSKILLCKNIKMDKDYYNVVDYTESQMLDLCQKNLVAQDDTYSFIRQAENTISTNFSYNQCLQSNYIAFQNTNYSNKWFFGWIEDIEYISDGCTRIRFKVDSWSTFFKNLTLKPCLTEREHVNDDTIGKNTVPEGLETGEYICNEYIKFDQFREVAYIIMVNKKTTGESILATNYGGVWSAGGAYICNTINEAVNILQSYGEGLNDAILGFYMCPKELVLNKNTDELLYSGQETPAYLQKQISKPTTINGYTPKNNKLLTFPYCYLNVSNNNGTTNSYQYELFDNLATYPANTCVFQIKGVPTVGTSIKCNPISYKGTGEEENEDEGITGGKFPTLSWNENSYLNWLTQNSVNLGIGTASSLLTVASGIMMLPEKNTTLSGASSVISGAMSLAQIEGQKYQHSLVPQTSKGNVNVGDINTSDKSNTFYFMKMSIKQEYAKIIDDYFSRFGYQVNRIKTPNITGRKNWNYIEISSTDEIGYGSVPYKYLDEINLISRRGTTIWHNHDNLGNFNLDNSIN